MKNSLLLLLLIFLFSCNDPVIPQADGNSPVGSDPILVPSLGIQVKVAYVHLKSLSYEQIYQPEIRNKVRELLEKYEILYMYIEAGEGLRYWDFGLIKLENNIPTRNWTTGDYNETRKWNYLNQREENWEDNSAIDYSFTQHGFKNQFTKSPFAMHYRSRLESLIRLNVVGANIDHSRYDQEMDSMNNLLTNLNYWGNKKTVAFGNFTKDCANKLNALVIEGETCTDESVWISPELKDDVAGIDVLEPVSEGMELITDKPIIEVTINI